MVFWKKAVLTIPFALFLAVPSMGLAQNRMDLDDVEVKGELLNDSRLRTSSRAPAAMDDRVRYKTSFKTEMLEDLSDRTDVKPAKSNDSSK